MPSFSVGTLIAASYSLSSVSPPPFQGIGFVFNCLQSLHSSICAFHSYLPIRALGLWNLIAPDSCLFQCLIFIYRFRDLLVRRH
ncbi:uncharacterized protein LY89DRAFT_285845 [Mollisia scopiformis]|uniref:Uncharacterized protein n=1 Tax=Mollisia scopiformis TaxID=149040 RepID=A0A132BAC5_MOLSC|nr:uncharacterized protein LY89DRAFT_285845 [Mollisia scopiformis]KUJ09362.1 hypothetical protein LY89DRAFT_285845 [Mollisia scopiformis]